LIGELIYTLLWQGNTYPPEHRDRLVARLPTVDLLVQHDGLDDLIADRMDGAERGHRLLKNEGDLSAPDGAHLTAVRVVLAHIDNPITTGVVYPLAPQEENLPRDDAAGSIDDAQDRPSGDALAAAAFPDNAKRAPWKHIEAGPINRLDDALVLREVRFQLAHR